MVLLLISLALVHSFLPPSLPPSRPQSAAADDVYFIESGEESEGEATTDPQLTPQEKGDMLRAKVRVHSVQ